ncbi:MAG: hypothetical protein HY717_08975 [Planctomycetes bacterium]|nr:hypothetical protein [Planctomycetota bacterium]
MSQRLKLLFDQLESAAKKLDGDEPLSGDEKKALLSLSEANEPIQTSREETLVQGREPPRLKNWRFRLAFASAAALLLAGAMYLGVQIGPSSQGLGLSVQHIPDSSADRSGKRQDTFHISVKEECSVLNLFRSWDPDQKTISWRPYRWRDGSAITLVKKEETIRIPMDVSEDPTVTQFILLAASNNPLDLPGSDKDLEALIRCLEGAYRKAGGEENLAAALAAAGSCLPKGATILGREFVVK